MYIILAILSGCLAITSTVINSQLAGRIGIFRGTLVNYIVGLLSTLLIFGAFKLPIRIYFQNMGAIPLWAFLGGPIGVFALAAANIVVPRIPVVYVALLTFTGQIITGIVIDLMINGLMSYGKIIGAILIVAGVAYNSNIDRIAASNEK